MAKAKKNKPAAKAKSAAKPAKAVKKAKPVVKSAGKAPAKKAAVVVKSVSSKVSSKSKAPVAKAAVAKAAPAKAAATSPGNVPAAAGKKKGPRWGIAPKPADPKGRTLAHAARPPKDAEELKRKLGALTSKVTQIRTLRRALNKNFYEIGILLRDIEMDRLFESKGYGTFENFVERELDLGKRLGLRIARVVSVFLREAAEAAGLEKVSAALIALEGGEDEGSGSFTLPQRSPIPLHKQ